MNLLYPRMLEARNLEEVFDLLLESNQYKELLKPVFMELDSFGAHFSAFSDGVYINKLPGEELKFILQSVSTYGSIPVVSFFYDRKASLEKIKAVRCLQRDLVNGGVPRDKLVLTVEPDSGSTWMRIFL